MDRESRCLSCTINWPPTNATRAPSFRPTPPALALTSPYVRALVFCRGVCLLTANSVNVCRYSYAASAIGIVAALITVFAMVSRC